MKKLYFIFLFIIYVAGANAQVINFPDAKLKQRMLYHLTTDTNGDGLPDSDADSDNDGEITIQEAAVITNMELYDLGSSDEDDITDLTGLEYFTALEQLDVSSNLLTEINVILPALKTLYCDNNLIDYINFNGFQNLVHLSSDVNPLPSLDLSGLAFLETVNSSQCATTSIDFNGAASLKQLFLHNCQLTAIDVTGLANLEILMCTLNPLTSIDVSGLERIKTIYLDGTAITSLDLSGLTTLEAVYCGFGPLASLNINNCSNLTHLSCHESQLTFVDFSQGLSSLWHVDCHGNLFTSIDLSQTPAQELHFSSNPNLEYINIRNGAISNCMLGTQPTDYTCHMFMDLPSLETVCVDDDEASSFFTGGLQANVQFTTTCGLGIADAPTFAVILYPNPVNDELIIEAVDSTVTSIYIYNLLGQQVTYVASPVKGSIDTSFLKAGTFIVQIITDKGTSCQRLIKL